MGQILRLSSSFARPADATAYAAGDEISNNATAGSVVRPVFDLSGFRRGTILRAGVGVTPASGNVVITAFDFNMLLFKTAEVPAAVGDNVTFPVSAANRALAIAAFRFDDGAWTNQLGALTAGTSAFQEVPPTIVIPTATPVLQAANEAVFEFRGGEAATLTAALQVLAAWTPTAVVNTFNLVLDVFAE